MRLAEMILLGLCVSTIALIGETAVLSYLEPAYRSLLSVRTVSYFWLGYAAAFGALAVVAWLLSLPLRFALPRKRDPSPGATRRLMREPIRKGRS